VEGVKTLKECPLGGFVENQGLGIRFGVHDVMDGLVQGVLHGFVCETYFVCMVRIQGSVDMVFPTPKDTIKGVAPCQCVQQKQTQDEQHNSDYNQEHTSYSSFDNLLASALAGGKFTPPRE
jgi:hypothetical protein